MSSEPFSPQIRLVIFGRFINDFGRGFTAPFFSLYFKDEVGLSETIVAVGMSCWALVGGLAVLFGAYFTDRFGRRRCLLVSMLGSAILHLVYPWVTGPISYIAVSVVAGGFLALYWPSSFAMLTDLSTSTQRARVFSWLRVAVNAGVGLGGLAGGLTLLLMEKVTSDTALPYHVLFYVDAATYFVFFVILLRGIRESLPAHAAAGSAIEAGQAYLFWNVLAGSLLASTVGLGALGRWLPAAANRPRG